MRKLILSMFMSLDGYFAGPNGEFIAPDWSDDMQQWSDSNTAETGMLLYGRVNFEFNAGYWQGAEHDANSAEKDRAFAKKMNEFPKICFSRSKKEVGWNGRVVSDNIAEEINRLKREPGKALMSFGGANLASTLIGLDIVDEYRLLLIPHLQGSGTPLFKGGFAERKLKLIKAQPLDTGAVMLCYERARN